MESHLSVHLHRDRFPILRAGIKAPFRKRLNCLLIQAHAHGRYDADVARSAPLINHEGQRYDAFVFCLPRLG